MNPRLILPATFAAVCLSGCFHVKTESEIKPIHITMDVNLHVDNKLAKEFSEENFAERPQKAADNGDFAAIKKMLDRKAAGVTSEAMLVARDIADDDERILIAEANARRMKRFSSISKESGVSLKAVQQRYAAKIREKIPAGSGIWYQDDDGTWRQK